MSYRQSEMFVKWLHDSNPGNFDKLFSLLNDGKTLDEALLAVYGLDVQQAWKKFIDDIKHNKRVNLGFDGV